MRCARWSGASKPHQLTRTGGGSWTRAHALHGVGRPVSLSGCATALPCASSRGRWKASSWCRCRCAGPPSRAAGSASIPRRSWPRCSAPECDTRMCWEAGNDQVIAHLALAGRAHAGRLSGPSAGQAAAFRAGLRWRDCAPWSCLCCHLVDCATHIRPGAAQAGAVAGRATGRLDPADLAPAQLQRDLRWRRRSSILPRARRAQDYLQAHRARAAQRRAAGAGGRRQRAQSLQRFAEFLGVSPMHYLRDLRMERARTELLSSEAASRRRRGAALGFAHMGRFQQRLQGPLPGNAQPDAGGTGSAAIQRRNRRRSRRLSLRTESPAWPAAGCPRAGCAPRSPSATSA